MKSRLPFTFRIFVLGSALAFLLSPVSTSLAMFEVSSLQQSQVIAADASTYLTQLSTATYRNLKFIVEPSTGFPHDHFDAVQFDVTPQFAVVRKPPYVDKATNASLVKAMCAAVACVHSGDYGLRLTYQMPAGTWGSYNIDSPRFNVSRAIYLEAWVKGAKGGERFEFVLWSNCNQPFPGRPDSAQITATSTWRRLRIPLNDFVPYANLSSLCRLSIGFNDALSPGGTIYLDQIAFVDASGGRIHVPLDESTNITNVGLYIADVIGALDQGWESPASAIARLNKTLTSIERLQKSHGFPHGHVHVVSLRTELIADNPGDRCRENLTGLPPREASLFSTVDLGNLAAGLILLRQRIPELAARADALVDAMQWNWLYDGSAGLLYGCRASDGTPSSWWYYDWLAADSRLAYAIAIGTGKIPAASWGNLSRAHEKPRCLSETLWHFEPGWDGGGLFMAFLPGIFLDEIGSILGISANRFARDQICEAQKIGAPAWGWSATVLPDGTYCGYGCLKTDFLVPHASILAADYLNPTSLMQNLQALEALGARPRVINGAQQMDFGFRASVSWKTGRVASTYLFLDQSMAFLSLVNQRDQGRIRQHFCQDPIMVQVKALPDYRNSCP